MLGDCRYLYNLHKLRKNQWRNPSELNKLQLEKLKALLHNAYYKVDYYRRLFDHAGIKPEDIKTVKDLSKIPITSRREIQALPKGEIIAKDAFVVWQLRTSGSTGIPLDISLGVREINTRQLFYRRMYFANSGKLTDKQLIITSEQNFRSRQWFHNLGVLREKYISIFEDIENQLKAILEFKPDIISGYASSLKNLAIEAQKQKIKNINPRMLFSTAELITEQDREFISSVFKADLFDYYACNECGVIAWECKEHFGYHIDSDNVIVEFIKEDGTEAKAGEEGEIIITSLNSYTMPFIRYKIGDVGVPSDEKCPCGRTLPMMKIIAGRINDCIKLPDNRKICPYILMITMDGIKGVRKYSIHQEEKNKIRIDILQNEDTSPETLMQINKKYKEIFGRDVNVEVTICKEYHRKEEGKLKTIFSKVSDSVL